jgi:hypothetical protein
MLELRPITIHRSDRVPEHFVSSLVADCDVGSTAREEMIGVILFAEIASAAKSPIRNSLQVGQFLSIVVDDQRFPVADVKVVIGVMSPRCRVNERHLTWCS